MAFRGGTQTPTPNYTSDPVALRQCGNCVTSSTPCPPLQPCITYGCVTGGTTQCSVTCGNGQITTTRTCMAYSNGQANPVAGMDNCL